MSRFADTGRNRPINEIEVAMASTGIAKSWFWMAVLTVVVFLIVGVVLGTYCRPGTVSYFNYQRITNGMTLSEVERLSGAWASHPESPWRGMPRLGGWSRW
jgi:cytochrome b subunit of formate dehydrogenase